MPSVPHGAGLVGVDCSCDGEPPPGWLPGSCLTMRAPPCTPSAMYPLQGPRQSHGDASTALESLQNCGLKPLFPY